MLDDAKRRNSRPGTSRPERIAHRLRAACLAKGWDVGELARRAGVSRTTLYHLQRGETRHPRNATLNRIAVALDVPPDELTGDESTGPHADREHQFTRSSVFDRDTNTYVKVVCEDNPELFRGWNQGEWDELYSTFGTGGALNSEGVVESAQRINAKRETSRRLSLLLETHLADVTSSLIDALYKHVQPRGDLFAGPQLSALIDAHRDNEDPRREE